ncbi:MAG: monovalent cation/H+ antiporter subunit E [Actinobacteria bacterium]|nr:monovalent cation/H+ antiporter subunit E [Actinomycetota bacterium]
MSLRIVRLIWLVLLWGALWEDFSPTNLVAGLAVALVVTRVTSHLRRVSDAGPPPTIRPLPALKFLVVFLWLVLRSSITVAVAVVAPRKRIHTGIVAVPLVGCGDVVATIVASAVTLTPGTLTIEALSDPTTLYIHALDTRDVDDVRAGVRQLEVLAVNAFGSDEARAGLSVDDTTAWEGDPS